MATRLYLDATAAPTGISPAPDASWENVSLLARAPTGTAKSGDPMATVDFADAEPSTSKDVLFRQYVSAPLTPAQSITSAGSFEAQCRVSETFIANNMLLAVGIRVIASDGVTVRKTLSPVSRGATEAAVGSLVNRRWTDPAGETYTTVEGDRIVVEVGMGGTPGGTGSHSSSMRLGSASGTDLPEDNIETSDWSPWVELPDTLTFDGEPTTTTAGPTTTTTAGPTTSTTTAGPTTTTTAGPTTSTTTAGPTTTTTAGPTTSTTTAGPTTTTTAGPTTSTSTAGPTTTTTAPPTTTGAHAFSFAGSGLMAEWGLSLRRIAGAGLTAEWVRPARRIGGARLMVEYYPYYFNALWGDRQAFTTTCAQDIDLAALGPTKIVSCWTEPGDALYSVRVRAGLLSGEFMDFLVPGRVAARPGMYPRIAAVGPSKFVVAYYAIGGGVSAVCGRVDLQSDVECAGALELASAAGDALDVCDAGLDKAVVVFQRENDSNRPWACVAGVPSAEGGSGLTLTGGAPEAVSSRRVSHVRCAKVQGDYVAAIYRDMDDGAGYMRMLAVSGLDVSLGAEVQFAAVWSGVGDVASLSEIKW